MESSRRPEAVTFPSDRRGFTLLEVVLVISLLAVTFLISVPNVLHLQGGVVARDARQVYGALAEARATAVARQREVRFVLSGGRRYRVEQRHGTGWELLRRAEVSGPGTRVRIDGAVAATIRFLPQGRVDRPRRVVVEDGERRHPMEVPATGVVSEERPR